MYVYPRPPMTPQLPSTSHIHPLMASLPPVTRLMKYHTVGLCGPLLFLMGRIEDPFGPRVLGGTCEAPAAYNTLTPCGPTQPPGRLSPVPWITWSTRGYLPRARRRGLLWRRRRRRRRRQRRRQITKRRGRAAGEGQQAAAAAQPPNCVGRRRPGRQQHDEEAVKTTERSGRL